MAKAYDYVPNSRQCPYRVQTAIAAHNSVHATNLRDKITVYTPAPKSAPPAAHQKAKGATS